jgi:hypothetical protein
MTVVTDPVVIAKSLALLAELGIRLPNHEDEAPDEDAK